MPRFFWAAPDGLEEQQVQVLQVNQGPLRMLSSFVKSTDVLAPGEHGNQPLIWNDETAQWVPGDQISVSAITSVDSLAITASGSFAEVFAPTGEVRLIGTTIRAINNEGERFVCNETGIAFFGVVPVAQPSVTATSELVALNSLIAGLSDLGLVAPAVVPDVPLQPLLAPGEHANQPLIWNDETSEWVPGDQISVGAITSVNDGDGISIQTNGTLVLLGGGCSFQAGPSEAQVIAHAGASIRIFNEGGQRFLSDDTGIGFFGATPVAKPSITGVLITDQVNSLINALVALGLVTDSR
jgi:hypothetical protein